MDCMAGMLEPWLEKRGLQDATQVLIYFAVAKKGEDPTDGVTDLNPEGLTSACGKHAEAFAQRLRGKGLACHVLPPAEFKARMLEKLIWISVRSPIPPSPQSHSPILHLSVLLFVGHETCWVIHAAMGVCPVRPHLPCDRG